MNKFIKKGDNVKIIAGHAKGEIGEVAAVSKKSDRVTIEGVKVLSITKHVKPKSAQQKGGRVQLPGTIDSSNLMVICGECNEATRIYKKVVEIDGKEVKQRFCKKCDANIDLAAKKNSAKKSKRKVKAKKEDAVVVEEATVSE